MRSKDRGCSHFLEDHTLRYRQTQDFQGKENRHVKLPLARKRSIRRHFRQNRFDARVALVPEQNMWKVRSIEVLNEERLR